MPDFTIVLIPYINILKIERKAMIRNRYNYPIPPIKNLSRIQISLFEEYGAFKEEKTLFTVKMLSPGRYRP